MQRYVFVKFGKLLHYPHRIQQLSHINLPSVNTIMGNSLNRPGSSELLLNFFWKPSVYTLGHQLLASLKICDLLLRLSLTNIIFFLQNFLLFLVSRVCTLVGFQSPEPVSNQVRRRTATTPSFLGCWQKQEPQL